MQMSDHELLYEYNHAANRGAQVGILADLNAVSEAEMRKKLQELGAENLPPLKGKPLPRHKVSIDERRAMELYNEGLCDMDLAETLGVSRNTVSDWRKRNGLKCHRQRPGYVQVHPQEPKPKPPEPFEKKTNHREAATAPSLLEVCAYMGVEGLLRLTQRMQEFFPQAVLTAGGRYVRDVRVHIFYGADGECRSAEMELILEEEV